MMKSNRLTALIFGAAVVALSASPLMAQDAPAPGGDTPAPPAAASPTDNSQTLSGPTSGSDTQVKDADAFGFDFSNPTALTAEQMTVAKNKCNDTINPNAVQYSSAVRTFCEQVQQMN